MYIVALREAVAAGIGVHFLACSEADPDPRLRPHRPGADVAQPRRLAPHPLGAAAKAGPVVPGRKVGRVT